LIRIDGRRIEADIGCLFVLDLVGMRVKVKKRLYRSEFLRLDISRFTKVLLSDKKYYRTVKRFLVVYGQRVHAKKIVRVLKLLKERNLL
jgi:hypothetical protein